MKGKGNYTKGLISRCTNYKDSDIIFTLMSEDDGLQNFIARGAKKPTSKLSGHIEPINFVEVYYTSRNSLPSVSQIQSINSFMKIKSNYDLLLRAQYLVELSEKFFTEEANNNPQLEILIETINQLSKTDHPDLVILVYEFELLKSHGFGLRIFECLNCSKSLTKSSNYFSYTNGGFYCESCLGEVHTKEELVKFSVKDQIIFRSIERKTYNELLNLDIKDLSIKKLSGMLRKSISNVLGVQLKTSRFL